tara:strand:+ start:140 stop:877 length:738 start_codon:yes stop_codon:yes gene_type:complete
MNNHISYRSGNPALNKNTFINIKASESQAMTLEGTVNKTILSLIILFSTAIFSWNNFNGAFIGIGGIGGFIVALITIFKKEWAQITTPIYCGLKGLMLGSLSIIFENQYPGIVSQAIFLTFGILFALLFAYKSKIIKPSENFKLGIFAATGGIFIIYIINMIMSFFGSSIPLINSNSLYGIGFSLFVVIIASLNLVLDFDFIEQGAENGAPKYMEWYGAFGLMVTLIWLYLEILKLLAKLNSRRN